MFYKLTPVLAFALVTQPVCADLPLTVENLISAPGNTRVELSTTYSNSERTNVDTRESITVQTGDTSFITIPILLGERTSNTDALVTTAGIRRGLNPKTEMYGRASLLGFNQRSTSSTGETTQTQDNHFADAWIGMNRQLNPGIERPGLLGFAELQVAERQADGEIAYGKAIVIGGTVYQTYDPVVMSLTGALQLNDQRTVAGEEVRPGNSIILAPSTGFAVNDKVTLSSGVNWRATQAERRNGKKQGTYTTRTGLDFGVAYAVNAGDTVDVSVRPQVSGNDGVQISVGWARRFAEEPATPDKKTTENTAKPIQTSMIKTEKTKPETSPDASEENL